MVLGRSQEECSCENSHLLTIFNSNKFRAIMKQLEAEGATWTKTTGDGDASTKATGTPRKRKNQQAAAADGEDDAADDAVDDESPTKKSKTKRGGAKATKKGVKQEVVKEEEIIKGEENGEEEMEVEDE